ncbi:hypothetical protein I3843_10G049000 [Carya illinoinensis]|nr:hypothetical protein I3843_10G049000 [Carya illinoinensis]
MFRSNSSVSSRSGLPPDIINEEDCEISENDSNTSDQWHMPKIKIDSLYNRTWIQSKMKSLFQVKTIEQTFPVSRIQEQCVLFQKKMIKSFQEKGYKFMHIASVQVAIVPLVRKGINACVLLCLRDDRFKQFNDSVLGIVQTSLIDGPVHFNCYPDLTVDLFDKNVLSTLTLNVQTFGFDMVEGSRPMSLVYRIYYKVLSTSLEPKTKIKSPKNETVLMYSSTANSNITTPKMLFWKDVSLLDEWVLKQELPPMDVLAQDSDLKYIHQYLDGTVKIAFDQPLIKERRNYFASSSFTKEEGRKVVKTSHPPLETVLVSVKVKEVKASPFKISDPSPNENVLAETKKIIEQNNFVNQTLYTIGQQLDRIEDKVEKPASTSLKTVEKPLIILPEDRSKIHFGETSILAKIDQMLAVVKQEKPSVSTIDKNSPGQEILNTLNRMSMVAIAYYNNKLSQTDIVDILTSGFSGMLRTWWDKHLTTEARETIRSAIRKDEDGLPVVDTKGNRREGIEGSPDGVNTLIYTIVKHFVGTPSNITNRISDYLNNLRCNKMCNYHWYKDVFMSRVMLRDDSQKPYWKEKFIDGLPRLFAIKVNDSLTDISGYLNYDNYTYGDIVNII